MREKLSLGLWILTVVLMTASVVEEFLRQRRLSFLSLIFVMVLALSEIGLAVAELTGRGSALSRLWHSRTFSIAIFVVTFAVILAVGLVR
jgi:hypothetical protein